MNKTETLDLVQFADRLTASKIIAGELHPIVSNRAQKVVVTNQGGRRQDAVSFDGKLVQADHAMGLVIVEDGYEIPERMLMEIKSLGYEVMSRSALWRLECSAHLQGLREDIMTRKGNRPGLMTRSKESQRLVEMLTKQSSKELSRGPDVVISADYSDGRGNRADRRAAMAKARRANKKRK